MDVVEVARRLGEQLQTGLAHTLRDHPLVGDIRGVGFIAGIELVANRRSREDSSADRAWALRWSAPAWNVA